MHGITGALEIPASTTSVAARVQNVAIQRGVNLAVSTTIGGESFKDSLQSNAIGGLVDFGAGLAAQKIGEAYHGNPEEVALSQESGSEQNPRIDYVTHKLAHGIVGGVAGGILGGSEGAIAGATGAIVSEVVAEKMKSGAQREAFKNVKEEEVRLGRPLTQAEFEQAYHKGLTDQFSYIEDVTKLSAASVALLGGMDVRTSVYTAGNAVDNNFFFLGVFAPEIIAATGVAITVGKISWEIYALTHEEELAQTRQEICEYVGEKLDVEPDTVGLVYDGIMMGASVASAVKQGGKTLLKKFGKETVHTGVSTVKSGPGSGSSAPHGNADGKVIDLNSRVVQEDRSPRIGFKGRDYIRELEESSGVKISAEQRHSLKQHLQQTEFKKLTPEEKILHGKEYDRNVDKIKKDWEKNTGQKWLTYQEDYYNSKGKLIAKKGAPLQMHHIKPQEYGGPHEWWNIYPLEIKNHQQKIHTKDSTLFDIMREYK